MRTNDLKNTLSDWKERWSRDQRLRPRHLNPNDEKPFTSPIGLAAARRRRRAYPKKARLNHENTTTDQ